MTDWEHIRDEIRTAIKPHICRLCGLPIRPMEKYLRRVGTSDGDIYAVPMHIECERHTEDWDDDDFIYNDPQVFRKQHIIIYEAHS